jgi:hypothetical protein
MSLLPTEAQEKHLAQVIESIMDKMVRKFFYYYVAMINQHKKKILKKL